LEDGQVSPEPTKTAATNEHRRERSEQSNRAPVRERNTNQMGEAPVKYELPGAS
jgi:hypothetical protein